MLTASQINALREKSEQLLDPVIEFLIEDIAKRVSEAGQMTGTAAYQVWRVQQLGMSQRQLKKEVAKRLKVSQKNVEKLFSQAAEADYKGDISRLPTSQAVPLSANSSLQQVLDATVKMAQEDLSNMTQTIGFVGSDGVCRELTQAYQQACDFAFQKVSTGAQDYISAVREATKNLAKKGIRTIDYESGVHTSLEAAVRRNIMGGMGLMHKKIAQQNHDNLGCNGWEISAHSGSAPDHEPIQGKQYSDAEYTRLNNSLVRRIGELNCGHDEFPIILGVNAPQFTPEELEEMRRENEEGVTYEGKHYTLNEAIQRQRKLERAVRDRKHRILIDEKLGDKDKLQQDQIRLQLLKQEYKRFSKAADLPMQHERMEAAGFDWKKGKAAEKAAKRIEREKAAEQEAQYGVVYGAESMKVDWGYIDSEAYRAKFERVTDDPITNDHICETVKTILRHRDNTEFEDIYLLGMDGATISAVTDSTVPHGVYYTEEFREALRRAKEMGTPTIAIHNHPHGYPPSADDFEKAFENQYEIGIAIGHNGQVYVYKNRNIELSKENIARIAEDIDFLYRQGRDIDNASRLVYDGYGLEYTILEGDAQIGLRKG